MDHGDHDHGRWGGKLEIEQPMDTDQILSKLPYAPPFLFVDKLLWIDGDGAEGTFTFKKDFDFYQGHFKEFPVTPGVLLTECCAQIGLVCLGMYLIGEKSLHGVPKIAFTSAEMEFLAPVFPGDTVKVVSKKNYFRFGKLKCRVELFNERGELSCRGVLAGMFKNEENAE